MQVLEYTSLACLFCLGIISSYTDIKDGIIKNRYIAIAICVALALDGVYYGVFARDVTLLFGLNSLSTIALALCLFLAHDFAGGDCKLVIALSLLYPSRMYMLYAGLPVNLFLVILFSIFYGYLYLLGYSLLGIARGKIKVDGAYIKRYVKNYAKSYSLALIYVVFLNLVFQLLSFFGINVYTWVVWILSMIVAWTSTRIPVLKNRFVLIAFVVIDIVISLFLKAFPLSINPRTYLITALLLLSQMSIRASLYDEISTQTVKRGMILSVGSSMMMQNTKIQGLPSISTESLKDRLSDEQAASIRAWGQTRTGQKTVVVIKKIPFAIFLFLGYITYFVLWSIM